MTLSNARDMKNGKSREKFSENRCCIIWMWNKNKTSKSSRFVIFFPPYSFQTDKWGFYFKFSNKMIWWNLYTTFWGLTLSLVDWSTNYFIKCRKTKFFFRTRLIKYNTQHRWGHKRFFENVTQMKWIHSINNRMELLSYYLNAVRVW